MKDFERVVPEELAILSRLAEVHAHWAASRPAVDTPPDRNPEAMMERLRRRLATQQPPDVERMVLSRNDSLQALLHAELACVGWRLYARAGADLMSAVYLRVERDYNPGFASMTSAAWANIGLQNDPRSIWSPTRLL
jgi:hypothetical protein